MKNSRPSIDEIKAQLETVKTELDKLGKMGVWMHLYEGEYHFSTDDAHVFAELRLGQPERDTK